MPIFFLGAPFLPSFKTKNNLILKNVFEILKKEGLTSGKFIDLGSGDGRVVIEFAKNNYEAFGIEINPILILISKIKIKLNKINNAKIIWGNFWDPNFNDFDIIYLYQYNLVNNILENKIKKESKLNTIIISNSFEFKNLNLIKKSQGFFIYKI
ncbi:MAG: class I SAM-dependent methyltransferase [Minisyncoccia bacterium]